MKRRIRIGCLLVMMALVLGGCTPRGAIDTPQDGRMEIVCTIFPQYDWVRNIIGEGNDSFRLTLLLENGVDIHSYQPSAADIARISSCDVFIYVGGESDQWVDGVLAEAANKDMVVLNLMELLEDNLMEEELAEGMQAEEHDHEEGADYDHEEAAYDEHIWLSVKNAGILCEKLTTKLEDLDAANAQVYQTNLQTYATKLQSVDAAYEAAVKEGARKTVLFGDRFPFLYLTEDYGIDYYAAFAGCSAETEASFETITFLSEKMDEEQLPVIFTIDQSSQALAQTIINNTENKNQKIISLNSMQSVTAKDIEAGATYISIMESNLEGLKEALK